MSEKSERGFSFVRHVITLSAGAIALQIGFLEKIFPHPKWKALIAVSVGSFTLSIVSAVISEWALLAIMTDGPTERWKTFGGCFVILMGASFVVGLISGVFFALVNMLLL